MGWGMSGGRGGQGGGRSGAVYIKHKTIIKTEKGNIYFKVVIVSLCSYLNFGLIIGRISGSKFL